MRPQLLIGDVFANAARAVPTRTAVVHGTRSMDFATVESSANRLGRRLAELGVGRGHRVVSWCDTTIDAVPLFAALAKLGVTLIPLSGLLGPAELRNLIALASPDLVVADEAHRSSAGDLGTPAAGLEELLAESASSSAEPLPGPAPSGGDPHIVFFTSGSTGTPKGVVLSHETNYLRSHPGALVEPRGAMVCPYPLFHMGAWTIALQQWQARDAVVLVPPDASAICEAVAKWDARRLNCIPAVWRRILHELDGAGARHPLAGLRFADTGTSATPPELLDAIAALVPGACLRVFYGSTEAGTVSCLEQRDMARKPGSCGVSAPGVEVDIGHDGEVLVRSTTLFDGYLDDEVASAAALADGWFHTGDLGEIDDEGYLRIVGRTGELIRTGGESVSPSEVEAVLRRHPLVADVAVVGVPDSTWGEVVCAVIVPVGPAAPTVDEIRDHCRSQLAGFKHPRRLEMVDAIPRTPATGQVQRRLLVERLAA
ncbi:MAG TPA: class I adenylate-forming enzyme family protein, partial [Acidimicrobiales bacterium]|nr:class I adenylate-forming enzyme family protein [Acidimicrobiales bacterium]